MSDHDVGVVSLSGASGSDNVASTPSNMDVIEPCWSCGPAGSNDNIFSTNGTFDLSFSRASLALYVVMASEKLFNISWYC
jgi:hypothetical protein